MLKEIKIEDLNINPFTLILKKWMLISAKKEDKVNTMTASWGEVGANWGKYVATIYIRDSRYTLEFVDHNDFFSLCFFDESQREKLSYLGKHSGRDEDKIQTVGLTVEEIDNVPYFKEANLVFICKKLYRGHIEREEFIDKSLTTKWYSDNDYHVEFIGEIVKVLKGD